MIIRNLSLLAVAVLVSGCASAPSDADRQKMETALQKIGAEEYAGSERCLSTLEYDSVEVLDEKHLLFRGNTRDEAWLNELRHRCPGLNRNDTLAFEMHGQRLCSLDTATAMEKFLFWQRTGPTCSLGEFQELTDAQASLVKDAL